MLMITKESSARIPREVPALPKGHVPRKAILDGIKRMLFSLTPSESNNATLENAMLLVQGMGGAGKTVVATSIARDAEVGLRFGQICFVGLGQDVEIRELQRSLHFQIAGHPLDPSLREDSEIFAALQAMKFLVCKLPHGAPAEPKWPN